MNPAALLMDMVRAITEAGPADWWVVAVGAMVGAACALVGCFIVLRRLAMLGDAISHAVLPGIVVAFLFTGSRNIVPMLIGAGAVGLLTAFLTDALTRWGKLQSDAAIGVTFTWLFALGVILVTKLTGHVDLDVDCVLFGELLYVPLDRVYWGETDLGPRTFWTMVITLAAIGIFLAVGWKQLKFASFDPAAAAAVGINVLLWHYLLMAFVSMTTVAAFESVGAILVVAMLTVPPNTAYLLTDRLGVMVALSVVFAVLSAFIGYAWATAADISTAGAIATISGVFFLFAVFLSPTHGLVSKWRSRRRAGRQEALNAGTEPS